MEILNPFERSDCFPNCSCEFNSTGFISQPEAFITSLPYIFFALLLYAQLKRRDSEIKIWTGTTILLGLSSLYTHARFSKFAVAMDFASMISMMSFYAYMRFVKSRKLSDRTSLNGWLGVFFISLISFIYLYSWHKVILTTLFFILVSLDLILNLGKEFFHSRKLQLFLVTMVISFLFFVKDELKYDCHPHGYFFGHSIWHLGSALSIYLFGLWYFQEKSADL